MTIKAENLEKYSDTTQMLAQLGRFDFVSMLLAVVSIVLVVGGVFAFMNLRATAVKVAREEAKEQTEAFAEKFINEYLQRELPDILESYADIYGLGAIVDSTADDIAGAQEEE